MLKLDNNLLQEIGLGSLPEDQKRSMLQHIYDTLELRVGTQLANQMTDAQLQEFERFIDQGGDQNQAEALKWLEGNLPNYKDVVQQVFVQLKGEIAQMAPQILASAPAAAQPQPSMPGAVPQSPAEPIQPVYAAPQQSQPLQPQPTQSYDAYQPAPTSGYQQPQPGFASPAPDPAAMPQSAYVPPAPQPMPDPAQQQSYQQAPPTWQPPQPLTDDTQHYGQPQSPQPSQQ